MSTTPIRRIPIAIFLAICLAFTLAALMGLFGFMSPFFDLANHMQMAILAGLLVCLVLIPLVARTRVHRLVAVAIAGAGLIASCAIIVPDAVAGLQPRPPLPTDGRTVYTLMSHNLFGRNYNMWEVADEIFKVDPDIVAVQEYFDPQRRLLAPLLAKRYPYHLACAGGRRAFVGLFSKFPFSNLPDEKCAQGGKPGQRVGRIIATFKGEDGRPFTVITTHLDWPFPIHRQQREFAQLATAVQSVSGPLIVVGDFNSTSWSYALRDFAHGAGLTPQAHGLPTWPLRFDIFGWRDTMPFLSLDHVLTKGGIVVHALHAGTPAGSDHLPVVVKFSVAGPPEKPQIGTVTAQP